MWLFGSVGDDGNDALKECFTLSLSPHFTTTEHRLPDESFLAECTVTADAVA